MEFRQLGKDGPDVSALGFGAWPLGGGMGAVDEKIAIDTVRCAIDNGITLLDTAQAYKLSEGFIGNALADGYRDRCFLATKVSRNFTRQGIREAMENSLRELNVDCVDLYQIHGWPKDFDVVEAMETMAQLRQEGKTRYIGVSNFNADKMTQAQAVAPYHSSQPAYNLFDRRIEGEDIAYCEREGIGILAHSPLAKGLLTGRYAADHQFPEDDERSWLPKFQGDTFAQYLAAAEKLKDIAADKNLTMPQFAIAWLLRLPAVTCVLVGAKNPQQVEEHLGAVGIKFNEEELERIEDCLSNLDG